MARCVKWVVYTVLLLSNGFIVFTVSLLSAKITGHKIRELEEVKNSEAARLPITIHTEAYLTGLVIYPYDGWHAHSSRVSFCTW